ncbi:MAG: hypothetical protein GX288_04425 [Clostridiales bacterium]|nr:hypothetical protein [Clostridiales bacterium]
MLHCEHCKLDIRGSHSLCPLCGGIIRGENDIEDDVFPHIPTIYQEFNIFIRAMILVSISAVVISFAINILFTKESRWSVLVAAGVLCMWISLFFIIKKKSNIPKTIVWQVALISLLSVIWDYSIGWIGWSIDYVIPSVCIVAMIVMAVAAKILKIGIRDIIIYMFVDGIFGIIPVLFIIFNWVNVTYPSVICVAASVIFLSALLLFQGDNIKNELNKRMHI